MESLDSSSLPLRVLLVDDDIKLAELIGEYLKREGMEIHTVHNGETGAGAKRRLFDCRTRRHAARSGWFRGAASAARSRG